MSSEVNISLNNIQNIKTVNIKGVGVVRVRRLGAGEELDLSLKLRRLGKLVRELSKIDFMQFDSAKPEDLKKIEKLNKRVDAISDEIAAIKTFELQTYKRCFSDDKNGEIVDLIINTLSEEERVEFFKQIFGAKKEIDVAEPLTPEEAEELIKGGTDE